MSEQSTAPSALRVGSERMQRAFAKPAAEGHKMMNLFITAGYPSKDETVELILGYERSGADIIELGMPFSDPLADGPTIQHSSEVALEQGLMMDDIFDMVVEVRKHSDIPIVLMGYINPLMHYGPEAFFKKCAAVGIDGLILPDVPVE
ncbi:MAG: tryptophan synthase subunit alpha, partial [Cyclonatronaceae bacterium]